MSDALLEKTTINIDISNVQDKKFVASGEVLKFDGFLKVYIESMDDERDEETKGLLPAVTKGEKLNYQSIIAIERFTYHPPRYTEASLVKKLEELGIGRPSTYAPTISTIQNRGYVIKEDRPGKERNYVAISLKNNNINVETKKEITGAEKSKLFPNDIGMVVNDFLDDHFDEIMNYNFTATVEEEFDEIAQGNLPWTKMIDKFYKPFHQRVDETLKTSARSVGERILGNDPETGKPVIAKIGPYGPMVQLGEKEDQEKPKFASLQRGQHLETITLKEALELFKLPREIGTFEGQKVVVSIGRFGPYVRHDSKFYSLKKEDNPYKIELDRAIELIKEKREKEKAKLIHDFPQDKDLQLLNGRWGPYISYKKKNYKIPKGEKAEDLSYEDCMKIIKEAGQKDKNKTKKRKSNDKRGKKPKK
jgi:DNA topoisomerase-1